MTEVLLQVGEWSSLKELDISNRLHRPTMTLRRAYVV